MNRTACLLQSLLVLVLAFGIGAQSASALDGDLRDRLAAAEKLKEEGKWAAYQSELESLLWAHPESPEIWEANAFHRAYNVPPILKEPEAAWQAIEDAINLLRQHALVHHPDSVRLHQVLAFLFLHRFEAHERAPDFRPFFAARWHRLQTTQKREALLRRHHMSPVLLDHLTETFGPLDLRHPLTHSLYWQIAAILVERGMVVHELKAGDIDMAVLADDEKVFHLVAHQMANLKRQGHVEFDPATGEITYHVAPDLLAGYMRFLDAVVERRAKQAQGEKDREVLSQLKRHHEQTLIHAVGLLHTQGHKEAAKEYYSKAVQRYGDDPDAAYRMLYRLSFEDFVDRIMKEADAKQEEQATD